MLLKRSDVFGFGILSGCFHFEFDFSSNQINK